VVNRDVPLKARERALFRQGRQGKSGPMSLFHSLLRDPGRVAQLDEQIRRARGRTKILELRRRFRQEVLRDFFLAVADSPRDPPTVHPDLARELADAFDAVAQGYAHPLVRPSSKRPGTRTWPALRRAQLTALVYIDLAKGTVIADRHPVKTVSELFGVTRRLLRYWRRGLVDEVDAAVKAPGPEPAFTMPRRLKNASQEYRRWRSVDARTDKALAAPRSHRMSANRRVGR